MRGLPEGVAAPGNLSGPNAGLRGRRAAPPELHAGLRGRRLLTAEVRTPRSFLSSFRLSHLDGKGVEAPMIRGEPAITQATSSCRGGLWPPTVLRECKGNFEIGR